MSRRSWWGLPVLLAMISIAGAFAQAPKKDGEGNVRAVQGIVSDASGGVVNGAVVQLKNTKTLQIRSFITKEHGDYYFNGLSPDVDYELKADAGPSSSGAKTLSSFDNRKQAVINLQLKK
ncbi:MAG: carboxypeptidase-like regulatory domain-containing protein [Acidobacteriota bacterium]|nr:carboxypeptidase-like regulatory domain-containing protein [Acidobacteriota bacterium]